MLIYQPILLYSSNANIAVAGKLAIAGTAFFTSVSSTLMLQYCSRPYILSLDEVKSSDVPAEDRKFIATTLNFIGVPQTTEFLLSQVEKLNSRIHPFATFKVKDHIFFVFGGNIADIELRNKLTGVK